MGFAMRFVPFGRRVFAMDVIFDEDGGLKGMLGCVTGKVICMITRGRGGRLRLQHIALQIHRCIASRCSDTHRDQGHDKNHSKLAKHVDHNRYLLAPDYGINGFSARTQECDHVDRSGMGFEILTRNAPLDP